MKRAKIFMSAAVMSSFLLACSFNLFAEDQTTKIVENKPILIDQNDSDADSKVDAQSEFKKIDIESKEYVDDNNRFLGNYPRIHDNIALSEKIYSQIDTVVRDLNIDVEEDIYENVINSSIDENEKFAKITVSVNYNGSENNFFYYLDKSTMREISASEYEKGQENIVDEAEESKRSEQYEVTMVPLRTNAENLGWAIEWRPKSGDVPARAILKKGNKKRAVFYNSTLDYDFVVTEDINKKDIATGKLDRSAELIDDSVLFVPSSFIDKFLKSTDTSEISGAKNN